MTVYTFKNKDRIVLVFSDDELRMAGPLSEYYLRAELWGMGIEDTEEYELIGSQCLTP